MNKVFYILNAAVDTEETGNAFPAAESYEDYDFNAPGSAHKLKHREFADFEPDLRFKLAKRANLCDVVGQATISGHGFLISKRFKIILERADLVPHKFYKATIEKAGILYDYYWVHFVWNDSKNIINFPASDFFARRFSKDSGKVFITNEDDLLTEKAKFDIATVIDFHTLSLKEINEDLFFFNYFGEIYVTEKFKAQLQSHNLTGIEFKRADKLRV